MSRNCSDGLRFGGVEGFHSRKTADPGAAVPKRQAWAHATAQAHRATGFRLGCNVFGRVRARGDLPGPLRRGHLRVRLHSLDRSGRRSGDGGRGGQLSAERARLPVGWWRLRGRDDQPGTQCGLDGRQCAHGRLRAHRRRVDLVRGVEHRFGGTVRRAAQGSVRDRGDRVADRREPARNPRVGFRLRSSHLRLHRRHADHARMGLRADLPLRRRRPRRVVGLRSAGRGFPSVRHRLRLPHRTRLLVRLRRADGRRGDQQRRAGVPEAQVAQRRHHAAPARHVRDRAADGHHHAGPEDRHRLRARSGHPARRGTGGLSPEDADRAAGRGGVLRVPRSASTSWRSSRP